jgi:hypothetical protein
MKTQKQQVLDHMRARGSITTMLAFRRYGCCRLSQRIIELENDGHLINHTRVTRNGRTFTAYSLIGTQVKAA